jgi:hypothetical protein
MSYSTICSGPLSRRDILRCGVLGVGGLTLTDLFRAEALAGTKRPKSVIMIYMVGAPPHQDMFDLKPEAPAEYRGEFSPIPTNVPGIQISEHLPKLAKVMDRMTVIRSLYGSPDGDHDSFICYTGHNKRAPQPAGGWPSFGAAISKIQGPAARDLPAFAGLAPKAGHAPYGSPGLPGYLGPAHAAFRPYGDALADLQLNGITVDRLEQRQKLLGSLDRYRRAADQSGTMQAFDSYSQQAIGLLTSSRIAEALNLDREDPAVRERYGKGDDKNYGDGAPRNLEHFLTARRLVEAGVRVVTLNFGRWDFHAQNFSEAKNTHMPWFDHGLATLISDLDERGLLKDTAVVAWGEFGRTPIINKDAGRDHWPQVGAGVVAGGPFRHGQVIGATDKIAGTITQRPVHYGEVLASLYQHMGIDPSVPQLRDLTGRPQFLVDDHKPLPEWS